MTWEEICDDRMFRDLPFKVETNRRGQYIMSPARSQHGEYQSKLILLLWQLLPNGKAITECPVQTTAGVRVPDVAWTSPERRQPVIYTLAPEICVEVILPYNDQEEMDEKRALYFEAGAKEVWLCAEDGQMTFFGPDGLLADGSLFCPGVPNPRGGLIPRSRPQQVRQQRGRAGLARHERGHAVRPVRDGRERLTRK